MKGPLMRNEPKLKILAVIFAIWFAGMIPLGYFLVMSGPAGNSVETSLETGDGVASGEEKVFYLERGRWGVWLTSTRDFFTVNPNSVLEVTSPTGQRISLTSPPLDPVAFSGENTITVLSGVFSAEEDGFFSLAVVDGVEGEVQARFGEASPSGAGGSSRTIIFLIAIWLFTLGCAFFAFRETAKHDEKKLDLLSKEPEKVDGADVRRPPRITDPTGILGDKEKKPHA